ncbi:hypothetical protein [Nitrincola lacisaponensis]|uniref:hypothetical protein n=1 Tax=Nitrincola lacisaponensis TaxID=267850 RepID=UPI000564E8CF|nr:hypothetical protein [Nitrincola lacisaponensis]
MKEIKRPDGWVIQEIIDPKTGERKNRYFYKRNRAPRVQLKSKVAQQLAGYSLIEKDLRNVITWLTEIDKLHPRDSHKSKPFQASPNRETFNIVKGLYVASLTFYGKCFTSCDGRRVKIEKSIIDDKFKEAHEDIMHMRHNFAAHSGADSFEEVKIALVLHPKVKSNMKPEIFRELSQADFKDSHEEDVRFLRLAEHVRRKVISKIDSLAERIYEKEIRPKGKKYWYNQAK